MLMDKFVLITKQKLMNINFVRYILTGGYLWMVLGTSPKVTMDGHLYNQLCLLSSPTKLVGGLLTGPYAEDC